MELRRLSASWPVPASYGALTDFRRRWKAAGRALLVERLVPTVSGRAFVQLADDPDDVSGDRIPVREGDRIVAPEGFAYVWLQVTPPARTSGTEPDTPLYLQHLEPFARLVVAADPCELPERSRPTSAPLLMWARAGSGSVTVGLGVSACELFNLYLWADAAATLAVPAAPSGTRVDPPVWGVGANGTLTIERTHPLHIANLADLSAELTMTLTCSGNWRLVLEYLPLQGA